MIFINPKTEFAFKKIFGSEKSHGILISFLNGILYAGEPTIQDLKILDPYQTPQLRGIKASCLDVKAIFQTGETVNIEMQVLNVEGFEKRILYNATKAYSLQLDRGDEYYELNPVIALTITDFVIFSTIDRPISRFGFKEKDLLIDYPIGDLEMVFLELPKFDLPLQQLNTLTEKWIYFLKHAPDLDLVPDSMGSVAEIQQAFQIANKATFSREELDELERQAFFIQDQRGAIVRAEKEAAKQAAKQAKIEIAKRLMGQMEPETIAQMTDLTTEEVLQIIRSN